MIMNVAVPFEKHSPMFGHDASSHTVCRLCARRICLISAKRGDEAARTRIHGGFLSRSAGTILMRDARAVFAPPLCLTPASLESDRSGLVHRQSRRARCAVRIGASAAPAASTVMATPRSASCVTASPR